MSYVSTDIKKIIAEIIENKKEKGGVKNIYFVGCGGSLGALYPAKTFMEREAQVLRSAWINSNEFVHSTPKDFGENSIICLACHKGNTPETIQAAKLGKEKGAAVIILTWLEESVITAHHVTSAPVPEVDGMQISGSIFVSNSVSPHSTVDFPFVTTAPTAFA